MHLDHRERIMMNGEQSCEGNVRLLVYSIQHTEKSYESSKILENIL